METDAGAPLWLRFVDFWLNMAVGVWAERGGVAMLDRLALPPFSLGRDVTAVRCTGRLRTVTSPLWSAWRSTHS